MALLLKVLATVDRDGVAGLRARTGSRDSQPCVLPPVTDDIVGRWTTDRSTRSLWRCG